MARVLFLLLNGILLWRILNIGIAVGQEIVYDGGDDCVLAPGLCSLITPPNASVDIVAVHGMDGHWKSSWVSENGAFWLHDFLPNLTNNARILSYSYQGHTVSTSPFPAQIADHGRNLISRLSDLRIETETANRPIIFIGHSLGGLVIKAALTYADRTRSGHLEHHKAVKNSTYGVLYMGTPHQGADEISYLKIIRKIMAISMGQYANDKLLDDLKPYSPFLEELQDTYNAISMDFDTTFFYETLPTPVGPRGFSVMMVPKHSASVPGAVNAETIGLDGDHLTIVKYDSVKNANMQIIGQRLRVLAKLATKAPQKRPKPSPNPIDGFSRKKPSNIGTTPLEFRLGLGLPEIRNPRFTGRESILKNMSDTLHSGVDRDRQSLVLFNLGGVGKTQVALEFAYRAERNFSSIFWIDGSSPKTVFYSIRDILKTITSHYETNSLDVNNPRLKALTEVLNEPQASDWRYEHRKFERFRDAFRQWLSYNANRNWLVILDNVDDLESYNFRDLLPVKPWGAVLITTRRTDLTVTWNSFEVLEMDESECVDLLKKTSGLSLKPRSKELESAKELSSLLGYLPLAITQAGSYLKVNNNETVEHYLDLFKENPTQVLGWKPEGAAWGYRNHTVLTTWEISYRAIERQFPDATKILHLCGFLARKNLDKTILKELAMSIWKDNTVEESIQTLLSYSFLKRTGFGQQMFMVPLVHLWARVRLGSKKEAFAHEVLSALYSASLSSLRGEEHPRLEPHVDFIFGYYASNLKCDSPPESLLDPSRPTMPSSLIETSVDFLYGWFLFLWSKAEEVIRFLGLRMLDQGTASPPDWETLYRLRDDVRSDSRYNILRWSLCHALSALPHKHPRTLQIVGDYAYTLANYDPELSQSWYRWLLKSRRQVSGKNHPGTSGALLGIGITSPSCNESGTYTKMAARLREEIEGFQSFYTKNANYWVQKFYITCMGRDNITLNDQLDWNMNTFARYTGPNMPVDTVLSAIHTPPFMILKMADRFVNSSPGTAREFLRVLLTDKAAGWTWNTLQSCQVVPYIISHYGSLYQTPSERQELLDYVEAHWNACQDRMHENQATLPKFESCFSTSMHTRVGLLMTLIHASKNDQRLTHHWLGKILDPDMETDLISLNPQGRAKWYAGGWCGEPSDQRLRMRYNYHDWVLDDIAYSLHSIHSDIAPLSRDDWRVAFTSLVWKYLEDLGGDLRSDAERHLQTYQTCPMFWTNAAAEYYRQWAEKSNACVGSFLLRELKDTVDYLSEDTSTSCFADERNLHMCHAGFLGPKYTNP